ASPHRVETGCDVDNATPAVRQAPRQHGPRHQEGGNEVDVDDPAKLFRRRFPQFSDRLIFAAQETGADAGIVDQDIEAAKSFGRGAENFCTALVVRDVGTEAEGSFSVAAIFRGVLRFLYDRSVKFDGGHSPPGIE